MLTQRCFSHDTQNMFMVFLVALLKASFRDATKLFKLVTVAAPPSQQPIDRRHSSTFRFRKDIQTTFGSRPQKNVASAPFSRWWVPCSACGVKLDNPLLLLLVLVVLPLPARHGSQLLPNQARCSHIEKGMLRPLCIKSAYLLCVLYLVCLWGGWGGNAGELW